MLSVVKTTVVVDGCSHSVCDFGGEGFEVLQALPKLARQRQELAITQLHEASELIISNDVDVTVTTLEGEDGKRKIFVVREGDIKDADGKTIEKTKKAHAIHWTQGPEWTDEEREQFFESLEKDIELRVEADVEHMERKLEKLRIHEADGHKMAMKFTADCDKDADMVDVKQKGDGQVMVICKSKIMASALNGLKRAREDVKRDTSLSEETRNEILESLDEQIRELSKI